MNQQQLYLGYKKLYIKNQNKILSKEVAIFNY